ncbi:MAG TPA: hypothetical protein VKB30_01580 [Candidatus Limnocylindrales bacterium]|nr:hypothetical protein [Candidatus Limnocylindrales bacterium]
MDDPQGDLQQQDRTDAPDRKPSGELGGHPVNADETAPREHAPDPSGGGSGDPNTGSGGNRDPQAIDDEPGSDL